MPHLILEYSANLRDVYPTSRALASLHRSMVKSELFTVSDIKSRAYEASDFLMGEKDSTTSFAHVTVYLMEGRTLAQKVALSESLRDHLARHLPQADQISVDIRDMVKETYCKKLAA